MVSTPAYHLPCQALHLEPRTALMHKTLKHNHSELEKRHSARSTLIIMWWHDSAQWRESQGESGECSWWPITAMCVWNKGSPAAPQLTHTHIGCQQANELSSPVEISGHVRSIGRWELISVAALAQNNRYSGSTLHKEAGAQQIVVLTPTIPLWRALPEDCCSQ